MTDHSLKIVEVVAAVICHDGKILATQRGYGDLRGGWEFPGGKIEAGEMPEQALRREIREELDCRIEVGERLMTIEHDYPSFHLTMHCYWCHLAADHMVLREHEAARWLTAAQLDDMDWLPADTKLLPSIRAKIAGKK